jgi:tRNA uridine 5-carboxymethylaminomethyl modification enzyme
MSSTEAFDVVVVGLGHAGAEAALAAARSGCRTASITQSIARAGLMSCNPAIGGPGKSQLVHEMDALGAAMPRATDRSAIQLRILNRSKGPAIWATRAQVDRAGYAREIQRHLVAAPGLELIEGEVEALIVDDGRVGGLRLRGGGKVIARTVVLTTGTFMSATMHVGSEARAGGRHGDQSSEGLSASLRSLGMHTGRFKTGTPPRLLAASIDFGECLEQRSEADASPFSRSTVAEAAPFPFLPQRSCFATRTRKQTHEVVRNALHLSPLMTGAITGRGPRYCPSLEHKVLRFPDRDGHPVYLEPEGVDDELIYPAGLSTSLPAETQLALLRTIPGLSEVKMQRPGYAVEYDYLVAGQIQPWLETKTVGGLFTAGQINGSSGYEEAAGQGLVAGVNAARAVKGQRPWLPEPERSYLGVLCADLVQKGFDEPYRLLPARAEARLMLREGNAALRMSEAAAELGLADAPTLTAIAALRAEIERITSTLTDSETRVLRQPEMTLEDARKRIAPLGDASEAAAREVYLDIRYAPYEAQRQTAWERLNDLKGLELPAGLRFEPIAGLSVEAKDALERARPATLGAASALPGMSASALAVLAAHVRRRSRLTRS